MGLLFSRVGSEGYYSGLDKQLGKIKSNIVALENGKQRRKQVWGHVRARFFAGFLSVYFGILGYAAWVMQQPAGKFSSMGHAKRVAPAFVAPALAYAVYAVADQLRAMMDRRADAQILNHKDKLRKMVAELKDSTRYQRTQALLQKYDPDSAPPPPEQTTNRALASGRGAGRKAAAPANRAASAAATAVSGAGARLTATFGQLINQAANTLIADDPVLIEGLQKAQAQAQILERENAALRGENARLKQMVAFGGEFELVNGGFGSPVQVAPHEEGAMVPESGGGDEEEHQAGEEMGEQAGPATSTPRGEGEAGAAAAPSIAS